MRRFPRRGLWLLLPAVIPLLSRSDPPAPEAAQNLRVPVEHYANGQVKTQVLAERARVGEGGDLDAEGVRIEFYREDGGSDGVVLAAACRYCRADGTAASESSVSLERNGLRVSGTGFQWNAQEQTVTIRRHVRVVLPRGLLEGRATLPAGERGADEI
jgi:hypothetical protein